MEFDVIFINLSVEDLLQETVLGIKAEDDLSIVGLFQQIINQNRESGVMDHWQEGSFMGWYWCMDLKTFYTTWN